MPIQIGGAGAALTHDVSSAGVFFVLEGHHAFAGAVDFQMQMAGTGITFAAIGEIVRIEHLVGQTGVALRWVEASLFASEQADCDL
jgi:hypothetical protein